MRDEDLEGTTPAQEIARIIKRYFQHYETSVDALAARGFEASTELLQDARREADGTGDAGFWTSFYHDFIVGSVGWLMNYFNPSDRAGDPIIGVMSVGNTLMNLGVIILGLGRPGLRTGLQVAIQDGHGPTDSTG